MQYIYELVTLDFQNEHDLEHDLEHKPFSKPKIYDGNGDLKKRWYVYFSFENPETGKLQRMQNVYGNANRFKTKEERYAILRLYRKRLLRFLEQGFNPFDDNTELYQKWTAPKNEMELVAAVPKEEVKPIVVEVPKPEIVPVIVEAEKTAPEIVSPKKPVPEVTPPTLQEGFDYSLNLKTNTVSSRTLNDYRERGNVFLKWLTVEHPKVKYITEVDRKLLNDFFNSIQLRTSARNRNNFRTCLSALFQILEDNEIVDKNYVKSIKPLKSKPNRNKTYTEKQQTDIFEYLETEDPILLLFIKFVSYNLLRPIEICRLRIKDVDIENATLVFQAKNQPRKIKIIPELLLADLPDLSQMDGDAFLFTPTTIGGTWDAELRNRRDHFSKRFKSVVKDHFEMGVNFGLYSFRHTFITKLYRSLLVGSSPFAAKSQLMQITGHQTMDALDKYLRDIDAELPEDYSKHLN